MSNVITSMAEFRLLRTALAAKYKEKVLSSELFNDKEFTRECQPLAKYSRLSVHKIKTLVLKSALD